MTEFFVWAFWFGGFMGMQRGGSNWWASTIWPLTLGAYVVRKTYLYEFRR